MKSWPWQLEERVQRIVEKRRPLDGVEVVARHQREALRDGEEARRLRNRRQPLLEVRAVHDARELAQRGVVGTVLLHQGFEGAAASGVRVRIAGARRVEADGADATLDVGHFTRFDEAEGGARIDESSDQPRGRRAIHADLPSRHPLHGSTSSQRTCALTERTTSFAMSPSYNEIAGQNVERLAALSDGVFAVAMTLLVLDLRAPAVEAVHNEHDLWRALVTLSPRLIMYLMSFMTLGIFWVGQQTQLNHLVRSDRNLTWIHIAFLCAVAIMPFAPGVVLGQRSPILRVRGQIDAE